MKRFSNNQRKHNTALAMLLLWLFAVSCGIVNACVFEPRGADAHVAGVQPSPNRTAAVAGHTETLVNHDSPLENSRAPCTKVCDGGAQTLIKQQSPFDQTDRGPALIDSIHWAVAVRVVAPHSHMDTPPTATSEPPVRLRYSRLTL